MKQTKQSLRVHADYLYRMFLQDGAGVTDTLYNRIIKQEKLTQIEAASLANEFKKLLRA